SIKAGFVMRCELDVDEQGRIIQHGQLMEDVLRNSWLYAANGPPMQERTAYETHNGFGIQYALWMIDRGYSVVTFSRAPDNMSEQEADKVGFFTDTMTCVIQVVCRGVDGKLYEESAFVAGKATPDGPRLDARAVAAAARQFGFNFDGL